MSNFFPERLKAIRGLKSQRLFAQLLGIKQPMYARYESGVTKPSADIIILICRTFNVSADYLLGLSDVAEAPQHHHQLKVAEPPPLDYMA